MEDSVLVVFGDGRVGHHVVQSMGRTNDEQKLVSRIVAVCDTKFKDDMQDIDSKTLRVECIDFKMMQQNPKELERIMTENKARWLVVMPFGDTFQPGHVQRVLETFKKNRGMNTVMISHIGVESSLSPISQMQQAERMIREQFPESNCIIRCGITLQSLDYFAEDVQQHKTWHLPSGNGKFAPVCLRDDVAACALMITKDEKMKRDFANQTFMLTNNELIDGNALAQMTNSAFRQDVKFENITIDEARKIIQRHKSVEVSRGDRLKRHLLSSWEMGALLNKFELVCHGKCETVTDHVRKIAGKEPMSVADYLQKHEEFFKPRST